MAIISVIISIVKGGWYSDSLCSAVEHNGQAESDNLYAAFQTWHEPCNCPTAPSRYASINTHAKQTVYDFRLPFGGCRRVRPRQRKQLNPRAAQGTGILAVMRICKTDLGIIVRKILYCKKALLFAE